MAYRHRGFFYAMDTFREYQVLNDLWSSGQAPWCVWEKRTALEALAANLAHKVEVPVL